MSACLYCDGFLQDHHRGRVCMFRQQICFRKAIFFLPGFQYGFQRKYLQKLFPDHCRSLRYSFYGSQRACRDIFLPDHKQFPDSRKSMENC